MNAHKSLKRPKSGQFPAYAWPGGYPLFYLTADNGVLCPDCANSEECRQAEADCPDDDQWRIVASDVNWEDDALWCCNCDNLIGPAYGTN